MTTRAPAEHPDYLHTCAQRDGELVEPLSGHADNLEAVERAVARAKSSRTLTYSVIEAIVEAPHFGAGKRFWQWPTKAELSSIIDTHAPGQMRGEWQRGRALRNRAVDGGELDQRQVEELIGYARDVEFLAGEKKRR